MADQSAPPGWSYNPSSWAERRPLLGLAALGLLAAIYTAVTQLGVTSIQDPIFGAASSYAVTHSFISRLLPVPDGVLGVLGYCCDLLFGSLGGAQRWRTAPWLVALFSLTITGLGVVSLALTILQGAVIGHWCSVCLVSATASTLIFALGVGEALAALQCLRRAQAHGRSLWSALRGHSPSTADTSAPIGASRDLRAAS